MAPAPIGPPSTAVLPSTLPTGPVAGLALGPPEGAGADGFTTFTVLLRDMAGEQVVRPPDSRAYIEVSLEPPSAALLGRRRRQAFGGRASFRLRLSADAVPTASRRLRARVVGGGPREVSALFEVEWPRRPRQVAGPVPPGAHLSLPPPSPSPQAMSLHPVGEVVAGQCWHEPVTVVLTDAYGQTCPTPSSPAVFASLSLGQAHEPLDGRGWAPPIARQAAHDGVATFHHLRAPSAPGRYALRARVDVPTGGGMRGTTLMRVSNPFRVLADA